MMVYICVRQEMKMNLAVLVTGESVASFYCLLKIISAAGEIVFC